MQNIRITSILVMLLAFFAFTADVSAQCFKNKNPYGRGGRNSISLEIGYGLPLPMNPSNDAKFGDSKKFEAGLRYIPMGNNLGFRVYYSYLDFQDSKNLNPGHFKVNRFEVQGLYLLNDAFGMDNSGAFELESYIGLGAGIGKGETDSKDNMISGTIGLRPRILLDTERLHLYVDLSYNMLLEQNFNYNGEALPKKEAGSSAQLSVGLSYRL